MRADAYDRFAEAYLARARELAPELVGGGQEAALADLTADYPSLRRAFDWLVSRRSEGALELCWLLARYWEMNGLWFDANDMMSSALAAVSAMPTALHANVEAWLGVFQYRQGNFPAAHLHLQTSLANLRALGDEKGVADTLNDLGLIFDAEGRYEEALASYQESCAIHERRNDERALAVSYSNLGNTAGNMERNALAREWLGKSLHFAERIGDMHARANTLNNLGALEESEQNYDAARGYHRRSLELRERIRDTDGIATSHHNLAYLDIGEGHLEDAIMHLVRCVDLYRSIGNRAHLSRAIGTLGYLRMAMEDPAGGVALYALSEAINAGIGVILTADVRSHADRHLADAKALMGEAAYAEVWQRGENLSVDEAMSLAAGAP